MFGLSTKEVLTSAILNTSKSSIEILKQGIKNNAAVLSSGCEAETKKIMTAIRREYLNDVSSTVITTIGAVSQAIRSRALMAMTSPALCGYEEIEIENGIVAGELYAICYFAMKNKVAEPKDCMELTQIQAELMEGALSGYVLP